MKLSELLEEDDLDDILEDDEEVAAMNAAMAGGVS